MCRWDVTSGRQEASSGVIPDTVLSIGEGLVATPDGKTVVIPSEKGWLLLLDGASLQEKKRLRGHKNTVNALALSPDGKTLASVAYNDDKVKLYDLEKAAEIRALKCDGWQSHIAFSPSGKFLAASGGADTLWNVQTGAKQSDLNGHQRGVAELTFSPDGTLLVGAASGGRGVVVWELSHSLEQRMFPQGKSHSCIALAPGGVRAAMEGNNRVELRDLVSGKSIWAVPTEEVHASTFAPDGSLFALCKSRDKVTIIDSASGVEKAILDLQTFTEVYSLAFRSDGKRLAIGTGLRLQVWDLAGDKPRRLPVAEEQSGAVTALAFHPDGKRLALAAGPTLRLVNAETAQPTWAVPGHDGSISTISFSPDGTRILSICREETDQGARLWNTADGKQIAVFRHDEACRDGFIAPDDRTVVTLDRSATLFAWDADNGKLLGFQPGERPNEWPVFAPDRKTFLTGRKQSFHLWQTEKLTRQAISGRRDVARTPPEAKPLPVYREVRGVLSEDRGRIQFCAFSADGKRMVTVDHEYQVTVRNPVTLAAMNSFVVWRKKYESSVFALSPDGKRLAQGCADHTLRLWNVETGKEEHGLAGHENFIRCIAFSPNGRWLASATDGLGIEYELFLWDVATGVMSERRNPGGSIDSLAFSPDGEELFATCRKKVIRFGLAGKTLPNFDHSDGTRSVAVSPDGTLVAAGGENFHGSALFDVLVWGQSNGKLLHTLSRKTHIIDRLVFGPDGLLVVGTGNWSIVSLFDARTGKSIRELPDAELLALSPDGNTLVVKSTEERRCEFLNVSALRNDRLQQALAPAPPARGQSRSRGRRGSCRDEPPGRA